jgi:hypothetical protein
MMGPDWALGAAHSQLRSMLTWPAGRHPKILTRLPQPSEPWSGWVSFSPEERRIYFALSRLSWGIAAFVLLIVIGTIFAVPLRVSGPLVPLNAIVAFGFGSVCLFYVYVRKDPLIIILSNSAALVQAFVYVSLLFSYVSTCWGAARPLVDASLAAADQCLGADWPALLAWMNRHPLLAEAMDKAYRSLLVQASALVVTLSLCGMHRRLQVFLLALQITALTTSVVAALFPALGAYEFYRVTPAMHPAITLANTAGHVADVLNLRGTTPLLPLDALGGITTFPSFHTVSAVLFAWSFWPVRALRWGGLALNVMVIAATPLCGAHHFVDVLAGLIVAWVGIWLASSIARIIEIRESEQLRPQARRLSCHRPNAA